MEDTDKFTIRLKKELKLVLQQLADKEGKSLSDFVRQHLLEFVSNAGQKKEEVSLDKVATRNVVVKKEIGPDGFYRFKILR